MNPRKAFEQILSIQRQATSSSLDPKIAVHIRAVVIPQLEKAMLHLSSAMELVRKSGAALMEAQQVVEDEDAMLRVDRSRLEWMSAEFKRLYNDCPRIETKIAEAWDEVRKMKIDVKGAK